MKLNPFFSIKKQDNEYFGLLDYEAYELNDTSLFILESLQEGKQIEEIKLELLNMYDVKEKKLDKDFQKIVNSLKNENIIVSSD